MEEWAKEVANHIMEPEEGSMSWAFAIEVARDLNRGKPDAAPYDLAMSFTWLLMSSARKVGVCSGQADVWTIGQLYEKARDLVDTALQVLSETAPVSTETKE